ncbi:hypothetical protein WMY93_001966 [Mugilogobius chulae]|uniref:Uncharacterized protein n=1 Tax=Mugilogobius chulae TaxID=88201 RepID=A0AAW0PUE2_9GOBI
MAHFHNQLAEVILRETSSAYTSDMATIKQPAHADSQEAYLRKKELKAHTLMKWAPAILKFVASRFQTCHSSPVLSLSLCQSSRSSSPAPDEGERDLCKAATRN